MTTRLAQLVDEGSFVEHDGDLSASDPLGFPGYEDALRRARERTESRESLVSGSARIAGYEIEIALFDFDFLGGSMGEVAGERLSRTLLRAADKGHAFVLHTATGGARMQEGMRSLVQMPKIVAARIELARKATPFIAVLGHPTTGGVLASIGSLADVTIAQAGATIGFAGPRVAEAFTGKPLEAGSHSAESAFAHGLVDAVVAPGEERGEVELALDVLRPDDPADVGPPQRAGQESAADGWDVVTSARAPERLNPARSLPDICERHVELRGDRAGSDDRALVAAVARVAGRRAVLLALDRSLAPTAAAFRKALRCVALAVRLRLPLVTLIDTRGADPSSESEAAGVASAIAELFEDMLKAPVPVLSVIAGEGGSGGALAFAAGDVIVAYERSFFSVIGPEGAAQILWRDPEKAPEAARALKLSAQDLLRLEIVDEVIAEPLTASSLRRVVAYHLDRLRRAARGDEIARQRQMRWRSR